MLSQSLLQLLNTRFQLLDILLRYECQFDFLQVFLRYLKLIEKVLYFLTLFLKTFIDVDILGFQVVHSLLELLDLTLLLQVLWVLHTFS